MTNYDLNALLSPLDFEALSKDLIEVDLKIKLENFKEGRDQGIDLRYAPAKGAKAKSRVIIVQCKRYKTFQSLKTELQKERRKIARLNPDRYILTTSVALSAQQVDQIVRILHPFIRAPGDIYGKNRLNHLLSEHREIERRNIKLWATSAGVLDSILNAKTHTVSREEVENCIKAARLYVRNKSFDESIKILKKHHVCIIAGLPGIGKTTLARMLLLYHIDRKYDIVKIESDISEAREISFHDRNRLFYYDDFLGQTAQADKLNKNEDQKLLDFMASTRDSEGSRFVLTTREYILNQAKLRHEKLSRAKFEYHTCVVDLSKYTRRMKAQILYNHLYFSKLPKSFIHALNKERGYIGVIDHRNYSPRLVEYLTDPNWLGNAKASEYLSLFIRNLDDPKEIWSHAFESQLSDASQHLLLCLTTLPTSCLDRDLKAAFDLLHTRLCDKGGLPHRSGDFKSALKELDGTFVSLHQTDDDGFSLAFANPSIRDFMQSTLLQGELIPDIIASSYHFEQVEWLGNFLHEVFADKESKLVKSHILSLYAKQKDLFNAPPCSQYYGLPGSGWLKLAEVKLADRMETILRVHSLMKKTDDEWISSQLSNMAKLLENRRGKFYPYECVDLAKALEGGPLVHLSGYAQFSKTLCARALSDVEDLNDIDEAETLANLVEIYPAQFQEDDLDRVGDSFSDFIDRYAEKYEKSDPNDLRGEARRIQHIGMILKSETDDAESLLRSAAEQIEEAADSEEDEVRTPIRRDPEECPDSELESIFSTLA